MKIRVAINGFGRIGRNAFRVAYSRDDIEIVGINDLTDSKMLAYLLKHDTNYGPFEPEVTAEDDAIVVSGTRIPVTAEKDPANLPWADRQVDVVIESTGFFTSTEKASAHIKAGAKKVVISAPAKDDETQTIVLGANEHDLESFQGNIISNASCTTNSLSAVMDILDQEFGIEKAMLTTVHSYTASQVLQDGPAKGMRESRAAAQNIVPSTTGAAIAVTKTVPSLIGKFDGMSVRVPTSVVSLSDVTMLMKRDVTVEQVNEALKKATKDLYYQGIIDYTEEELVSSDYIGNSHSGTVDGNLTNVVGGNLVKVVVWYDNEWGYSNRLVELVADVGNALHGKTTTTDDDVVVTQAHESSEPQISSHAQHIMNETPASDPALDAIAAEVASTPVVHDMPTAHVDAAIEPATVEEPEVPAESFVEQQQTVQEEVPYQDISMGTGSADAQSGDADIAAVDQPSDVHPVSVAYNDMGDDQASDMQAQSAPDDSLSSINSEQMDSEMPNPETHAYNTQDQTEEQHHQG